MFLNGFKVQKTIDRTLLLPLVGQLYFSFLSHKLLTFLTYPRFQYSRSPNLKGTCRRHSDAQASKGVQCSVVKALQMMTYINFRMCVIYITFGGLSLLGQVKELGQLLPAPYHCTQSQGKKRKYPKKNRVHIKLHFGPPFLEHNNMDKFFHNVLFSFPDIFIWKEILIFFSEFLYP